VQDDPQGLRRGGPSPVNLLLYAKLVSWLCRLLLCKAAIALTVLHRVLLRAQCGVVQAIAASVVQHPMDLKLSCAAVAAGGAAAGVISRGA